MENTQNQNTNVSELLSKAKGALIDDMKSREIGAIIWDLSTVGFRQIPEVEVTEDGKNRTVRVTGLYQYDGVLYLIEEEAAGVSIDRYYDEDTEVKPSVVTLTEDMARKSLGDPRSEKGYTVEGDVEEWLVVADDYYQALTEYNPPM